MCIILSLILSSLEKDKNKKVKYDYLDKNERELVKRKEYDPFNFEEEELEDEEVQPRESLQQHESIALSKGKRTIKKPARYIDMVACASTITFDDIPTTYSEAVKSSEVAKWKSAMEEEIQSLQKNQTWKLVSLSKGKKVIGCK